MRLLDNGGWGSASTLMIDVPPALGDIAEHIWIDDWRIHRALPREYRIVADIAPHLIVNVFRGRSGPCATAIVVGARTRHLDVDATRRILTVGVRLRPGALPPIGVRHAVRLTNGALALAAVSARSTTSLRRLARAGEATAIADELCAHLRAMRRTTTDTRAVALLDAPYDTPRTVHRLGRSLGLGERGARSWARRTLGMSIRRFQSIRRLHDALLVHARAPELTWSQIAALASYADQSHLIRECNALLGETPARFSARAVSYKTGEGWTA
jgi:AraC-like DNA-binding protein